MLMQWILLTQVPMAWQQCGALKNEHFISKILFPHQNLNLKVASIIATINGTVIYVTQSNVDSLYTI